LTLRTFTLAALALSTWSASAVAAPYVDPRQNLYPAIPAGLHFAREAPDPACQAAKLVATGGAFPRDRHTLAVRWVGVANYELVYDHHIILLDTFYDRGAIFPALGVKAADVTHANVILLGHAHFDHMSDAASVGARTGATVVGAPVTTE
jgi:glyoxylase-like metal-dependent hydrolase (beta-lactamase superfamily II)